MELKDFIGKAVLSSATKRRFILYQITAPTIRAWAEKTDADGTRSCYCWETVNGDPITNGDLVFEDASLTELFIKAYAAYSRTKDAYWENYGYWMRKA